MWGHDIWFVLPGGITLTGMIAFPLTYTVWMSLHNWFASSVLRPQFIGLGNYLAAFRDDRFILGTLRTLYYTVLSVGLQCVLGLALALLLHSEFRGRGFVRTLFILPMVATPVAISLVWLMMFDPATGILGFAARLVGLRPILWINDARLVIASLTLVDTWQWTPLIALICLAGLATLPSEPYESALIDGATRWQSFRYITLPLLRPTLVVALLFRTIDALKTFDIIWVITQGGPAFASETLNIYVYKVAFEYLNIGYASALLVILFAIVLGISLILIKMRRGAW
jgi:multiple sugar transport system permease protein